MSTLTAATAPAADLFRAIALPPDLPDGIDLWLIDLDRYASTVSIDGLQADELARAQAFHFARDRSRYLAGRHALRGRLAAARGVLPESLRLIAESFGKPLDSHNMGALYSRITPSVAAEKPIGDWQTFDITLVDRHLTVVLNGRTIIDNQPVLGFTGGAMSSDEFKPGPIWLQGDHTNIDYRNIVVRPVAK